MNASADGDEPLGEHVDVTMPRAAGLIDRQAQALTEIREWATDAANGIDVDRSVDGRMLLAILDRLGV